MSFPPPMFSLFSLPCATFAPKRRPAPPLVIPLYATPIPRRCSPPLPVHRTLPERALFHPYAHARHERARQPPSPIVIDSASSASSSSSTSTGTTDSVPGSPLMPVEEDAPKPQAACVLIPAPQDLSVPTCGWHEAQQAEYRNFARAAVRAHLDVKKSLNTQGSEARDKAIQAIEDRVPVFKDHENHWGAVVVLKDQLKSMKDAEAKQQKREATKATRAQTRAEASAAT
ncbi:hypothetical protein L218DRAFT_948375 [Marasmius fiardii PR-910]|nr:hypothetical protein L218DRAFT_948375 [Marasmius fiardii PR-910]